MIVQVNSDLSSTVYDASGKRGFRLPSYDPRTMVGFSNVDQVHECAAFFMASGVCVDFDEADWHSSAHEAPAEEPAPAPVAE